jgi:hypothetical protein
MPDVITMLRTAIDDEPPLGFDAAGVVARAHKVRRRRRTVIAGLGVVGAAAGTALALSLTGVLGSAPARGTGMIQTAAFTLVKRANGTATLTINPNVLLKPRTLQTDLRRDGIPAIVTTGRFCSSHPSPAGFNRVVTGQKSSPDTMTINPAALPAGAELSFGYFRLSSAQETGQETVATLLTTNSYSCDRTAPIAWPSAGGRRTVVHGGIVASITTGRTAP